jgi:hypothetical protein
MLLRKQFRKWFARGRRPGDNEHHSIAPCAKVRLRMESLEDRLAPATLTDGGTGTLSFALAPNESMAIVSNGSTYTFSSNQSFTNGGVTNTGDFSSFGSTSLTLLASGVARYTTAISITDTSGASANDTVTFNGSGANSYANNFNVALANPAAGPISFNGTSSFSGASTLTATTTDFIAVNSGATVQTSSGNLTLSANQQATPTSGNFVGINVNGATVQSGTGNVLLEGTGGNSGSSQYGVEIQAGGKVQTTGGSGTVTVQVRRRRRGRRQRVAGDVRGRQRLRHRHRRRLRRQWRR